ncbi:MAG: DUF4145 domain-containing protein [Mycobacterium sp.]|nr:DUF4145 domain-containing protein [Mycobacterium sp.]
MLYNEAGAIADISPRGAAALLRTALEVLTSNHLGQPDVKLTNAIGNLVKAGQIDKRLQQAMDVLRVTGNDAVHPHQLRLADGTDEATALFKLLNLIVDRLVAIPQQIDSLYDAIPESKRDYIDQRDGTPAAD